MTRLFIFGFCMTVYVSLCGQEIRSRSAEEAVQILENGTFVLILPSYEKKLAAIDTLLSRENISSRDRKNLIKRKAQTLLRRNKELEGFASEFVNNYPFHRILLAYDTSWILLKHGKRSGLFIDLKGKARSDIQAETSIIVARPGLSPEQSMDAFFLRDGDGQGFNSPFPGFVLRHHVLDPVKGLYRGKSADKMAARRILRKLQKAVIKIKS